MFRSRIHHCGGGNGGHDHAIYSEFSRRAVIRDNYLYDNPGFGISMYPDTQYALIEHNVIDGNGYENRGNVTFSGEEAGGEYDRDYASSYNILRRNIISNARARYNVESYYPSLQPTGNLVAEIASGTRRWATSADAPATRCRSTSSRRRTFATGLPRTFAFVRSAGAAERPDGLAARVAPAPSAFDAVGTGSVATVAAAVDDPRRAGCHELPRVASP